MKLVSLQIFPSGQFGWKSDFLEFGKDITQLYGKNGCGKTPLVQTITYCLGYPSIFRNDIYDHCNYAILTVDTPKGTLKLKRIYSKDVDIEVTDINNNIQRFFDEKEYSLFLFDWLGFEVSNLVTTENKISQPYLSTLLPIFYLDQDSGYSDIYSPPKKFIKDQFSEMIRMAIGLPEKNSFDAKKEQFRAKERLDSLDRQVESNARQIELAKQNASVVSKTSKELNNEIHAIESDISRLKDTSANHDDSINVLDRLVSKNIESIRDISTEFNEISKRMQSVARIIHEINTEVEALNLNEEAKRVFLSFKEICGASHCQLFSFSSESYSKNLLYLMDQIKDLERNSEIDKIKSEQLLNQKQVLENGLQLLVDERNSALQKSEISALVDTISELKNQIFSLQSQCGDIEKVELLEKKHVEILSDRNRALDKYESFSKLRSSIPELVRARADLRQYYLNWLDILLTKNISRDITFKDDFTPVLGNETISQLKGSTRTRAVLAYHAALLELILSDNKPHFRFMILDTPKQHEIHNDDLDHYLKELKLLCQKLNLQIIFSTTEYHYIGDDNDQEWNPLYPGEKQNMFLSMS